MKIAHFGAFDAQSYGDLVSPLVLERRLSDLCDELVHVSPSGGKAAPEDCPPSTALPESLREGLGADGVVLGGGSVFGAAFDPGRPAGPGDVFPSLARGSVWLGAAYVAARDGVPLCWNAPSVARELTPITARLARWTASVSDYASVRDPESRRLLERSGLGGGVETVPDPALEVCGLWSAGELEEAYDEAFARRGMETPERSLVLDLSSAQTREDAGRLAAVLDGICDTAQATPIIVDLGALHGDDRLHRQVARSMRNAPLLLGHPRSLREVAACVARSEAYLGSSPDGMTAAGSFGKRGMPVAPEDASFVEQFGLSGWRAGSWEEARHRTESLLSAYPRDWERVMQTARPALDGHWERVREALRDGQGARPEKREALARLESLGEEYLGRDSALGGIAAEHLVEARSEIERLQGRVSELEGAISTLEHWMERLNTQIPALFGSRQWRATRILGELYRRARRRPRTPTAAANLHDVVRQYRSWKGSSGDTALPPPAGSESALEARARRVLRLLDSKKPSTLLRSVSGRAVAAGRRRARIELRKLKPRMPQEQLAGEIRRRLGPPPALADWPSISVVVLTRDGLPYLKKLFAGLEQKTDYPGSLELILVDNASSDGSVEFAGSFEAPFAVTVIENTENVSFSEGNNQGARLASGELLLFANNDVEPFESGWLREMAALLRQRRAGAVGARLV